MCGGAGRSGTPRGRTPLPQLPRLAKAARDLPKLPPPLRRMTQLAQPSIGAYAKP